MAWGRLEYSISTCDTLPARIDYYDENGELERHMIFSEVAEIDGRLIPSRWTMYDDDEKGHHTTMKILEMDFDAEFSERVFSRRNLESGV